MKKMKLIMENFNKTIKNEAWNWGGSKEDSEKFVKQQMMKSRKSREATEQAIIAAAEAVREEVLASYGEEYENIQDIIDNEAEPLDLGELKVMLNRAFGDAHAKIAGTSGIEAGEQDMLKMFDILDVLEDDENDGLEASDMDDPPGYMPGEGGNY